MTVDAMKALRNQIASAGINNVIIGDLPENRLDCVAIHPVDGYASSTYFGQQDLHEPLVQVLIRATKYSEGQLMYTKALKATDKFQDEASGILSCVNVGSPGYLGRSTDGFGEWHFLLHVSLLNV